MGRLAECAGSATVGRSVATRALAAASHEPAVRAVGHGHDQQDPAHPQVLKEAGHATLDHGHATDNLGGDGMPPTTTARPRWWCSRSKTTSTAAKMRPRSRACSNLPTPCRVWAYSLVAASSAWPATRVEGVTSDGVRPRVTPQSLRAPPACRCLSL